MTITSVPAPSPELTINSKDLARKALFTPCKTKEELDRWIRVFLRIRLPDKVVSEESNSSPLDILWQLYDRAVRNDTEGWRRSMTFASRFSGKCQEKGTFLRTKTGFKKIEDIKIGDVVWSGWAWRTVTDWIHDGEKDSATVELAYGQRSTGSLKHRVWAWEPGKLPDWKHIKDLTPEDLVAWDTTMPLGDINQEDYSLGYLLGLLQGDGCLTFLNKGHVTFTTAKPDLLEVWRHWCFKVCGRYPSQSKTRPYDYRISSKVMCEWLLSQGLTNSYSWEKTVPDSVTASTSKSLGFFAGLMDTDGTVSVSGNAQLHMTATALLEKMQVVLSGLGIDSQLIRRTSMYGKQKHPVWKLNFSTSETVKLSKILMCLTPKLERAISTRYSQTGIPRIQLKKLLDRLDTQGGRWKTYKVRKPATNCYSTISTQKVQKLLDFGVQSSQLTQEDAVLWEAILSRHWIPVKSVSFGKADFYDLTVDTDHSYWSSGFISHNTLSAAILEAVLVLHTDRNIIHMAAIKDQSDKALEYVKGFFFNPLFRDFVSGDNSRDIAISAHLNTVTGIPITEREFTKLDSETQKSYVRKSNYIRIIACTMQSTNGQHGEVAIFDEIDVIEKKNLRAYDQAKGGVPIDRGDMQAITLFTSTRKSRIGKVQEEIDRAAKTGLRLNHWNIIDITEPCAPERHKPDEPHEMLWINDANVSHITDHEYNDLPSSEKTKWYSRDGYAGCKTCPLFAACKSNLATNQVGKAGRFENGGTALLLPIDTVIDKFKAETPEFITTEFLCRKPDTSGLVFPRYNEEIHRISASQIAEIVNGEPVDGIETKQDIIRYLAGRGAKFVSGMDFGYSHLFAVATMAIWGNYAFVVEFIGLPKQELDDMLALTEHLIDLNSTIYADLAYPGIIATFKRRGYRAKDIKDWNKGPGSVKSGIDICRTKLYTKALGATVFFLSEDSMIDMLCTQIRDYHYTTGPDGRFTETPEKINDDGVDAWRYAIVNVFSNKGGLRAENTDLAPVQEAIKENWKESWQDSAKKYNANLIADAIGELDDGSKLNTVKGKKGKFKWSL